MNQSLRDALRFHPFFASLDTDALQLVEPLATVRTFAAGTRVARAGDPASSFLLVTSGRAGIELHTSGREPTIVSTVHAGEVIGWSWFVEPHRWHFDVVALDELEVLVIDAAGLRAECARSAELGRHVATRLVRVVASRLESTRHQLVDLYGHG